MRRLGIILCVLVTSSSFAQGGENLQGTAPSGVLDGVYVQQHIPTKKVISYPHLREADVMWSKRVWRIIDLREKINFPLYYPKQPLNDRRSLWDVIRYGVESEGSLIPYKIVGDGAIDDQGQFLFPIKPPNGNTKDSAYKAQIDALFYNVREIEVIDEETGDAAVDENGDVIYKTDKSAIGSGDVVQYKVKEDWFFDKQRSVLDVRIIAICPIINTYDDNGEFKGLKETFWLYFPECRYVFQNYFVYNRANDAQRMSFDDLFWKRQFNSFIYKETNVYDREVNNYEQNGVKALLESERIKLEMTNFEHDLWHL